MSSKEINQAGGAGIPARVKSPAAVRGNAGPAAPLMRGRPIRNNRVSRAIWMPHRPQTIRITFGF